MRSQPTKLVISFALVLVHLNGSESFQSNLFGRERTTRSSNPKQQQLFAAVSPHNKNDIKESYNDATVEDAPTRRRSLLVGGICTVFGSMVASNEAIAFEGGVGGLGKTKPETGVVFVEGSAPIQNNLGIVSAEVMVGQATTQTPVLVEFQTPWPLLPSTSGLEARDLQAGESAFLQVISSSSPKQKIPDPSSKEFKSLLVSEIFAQKGKYGAYGTPVDIKVTAMEDDLYVAKFTTYTPAMRESERKVFMKVKSIPNANSLVVLVTGTTVNRFKTQQDTLKKVADSFVAVVAPPRARTATMATTTSLEE